MKVLHSICQQICRVFFFSCRDAGRLPSSHAKAQRECTAFAAARDNWVRRGGQSGRKKAALTGFASSSLASPRSWGRCQRLCPWVRTRAGQPGTEHFALSISSWERCYRGAGLPAPVFIEPGHTHGGLTSLAPHERLPELPIISREKPHTGAAARENP